MRGAILVTGILIAGTAALFADFDVFVPFDHPAIEYATRPLHDPAAGLNRKIQDGQVQLKFQSAQGYLRSVLQALNIPIESQIVVFSKTSLQAPIINPHNPRTIFFNDSVAAGWVPGEPFVEIAAEDPQQGMNFYTLDQRPAVKPELVHRSSPCLECHDIGIPGTIARSIYPAPDGMPLPRLASYDTDHRSPFEHRWGGWYVTGEAGAMKHMGNAAVSHSDDLSPLKVKFDGHGYLSPYSDIVALMVFDHQMHMMNLLTAVGWQVRYALYQERVNHSPHEETVSVLRDAAKELADYMLFVDEAPLPGKVRGTSGFAEKFAAEGPRDRKGRSLRQFDLERHLMRYPCSYMIYSSAFDGLPAGARDATYQRMWEILSGEEKDKRYARLSFEDRQAVVEILRDTKKDMPAYFRPITR